MTRRGYLERSYTAIEVEPEIDSTQVVDRRQGGARWMLDCWHSSIRSSEKAAFEQRFYLAMENVQRNAS